MEADCVSAAGLALADIGGRSDGRGRGSCRIEGAMAGVDVAANRTDVVMSPAIWQLRPYRPRKFTAVTWKRFRKVMWAELLLAIGGEPSPVQRRTMLRVIDIEWRLAEANALLTVGKLSDTAHRNMISLDRQARIYRRELGLGRLRRAASRPAAPKPAPKPEVEPAPEPDLLGYLQRRATNGESSP